MIHKLLKRTFMTVMSLLMAVTLLPHMNLDIHAEEGTKLDLSVQHLSVSYENSLKGNIQYTAGGNEILVETSGYSENDNQIFSYTKITFKNE